MARQNKEIVLIDNRAQGVLCYEPQYTFVEKISAIVGKYSKLKEGKTMPANFIRHYYDVYYLLQQKEIGEFINSKEFYVYISSYHPELNNLSEYKEAFLLPDQNTRMFFAEEYSKKGALYYGDKPSFDQILKEFKTNALFKEILSP